MTRATRLALLSLCLLATLALAGVAEARGGAVSFDGGSSAQRAQVRRALEISSFDWNLLRATTVVHIAAGQPTQAQPGHVWLDADLLDAGQFSWGVVQHEFAHQADFLFLSEQSRARLLVLLGGQEWCYATVGLPHGQYGCERFASTFAWAFWQSDENSMKPESAQDESAAMKPAAFRALVFSLIPGAVAAPAPKRVHKPKRKQVKAPGKPVVWQR